MRDESYKISNHWGKREPIRDSAGFYTSPILRPYFIETAYGKDLVPEYQDIFKSGVFSKVSTTPKI